jgi:flavin reductase (DIM6/NTAB) family NADH-FMN oxidoreductase RutF
MFIDLSTGGISWREVYRLAITFVVPRPIALVSSLSPDGIRNLAPYSFFNLVSGNPPVLMVCPALTQEAGEKDTLRNIRAVKEFVVAVVTEDMARAMNECSAPLPPEKDEFLHSGLTPLPASRVRASLVKESPVNVECRLREIISMGEQPGAGQVIFGNLLAIHVEDTVLSSRDGLVDPLKLAAVGRLGRNGYCRTSGVFEMPRPQQK